MKFNLQRLKFERLSRGVTQEELAQVLKITRGSYHKKESGKLRLSVEEFALVLDALGIPESEASKFFISNVPEREHVTV